MQPDQSSTFCLTDCNCFSGSRSNPPMHYEEFISKGRFAGLWTCRSNSTNRQKAIYYDGHDCAVFDSLTGSTNITSEYKSGAVLTWPHDCFAYYASNTLGSHLRQAVLEGTLKADISEYTISLTFSVSGYPSEVVLDPAAQAVRSIRIRTSSGQVAWVFTEWSSSVGTHQMPAPTAGRFELAIDQADGSADQLKGSFSLAYGIPFAPADVLNACVSADFVAQEGRILATPAGLDKVLDADAEKIRLYAASRDGLARGDVNDSNLNHPRLDRASLAVCQLHENMQSTRRQGGKPPWPWPAIIKRIEEAVRVRGLEDCSQGYCCQASLSLFSRLAQQSRKVTYEEIIAMDNAKTMTLASFLQLSERLGLPLTALDCIRSDLSNLPVPAIIIEKASSSVLHARVLYRDSVLAGTDVLWSAPKEVSGASGHRLPESCYALVIVPPNSGSDLLLFIAGALFAFWIALTVFRRGRIRRDCGPSHPWVAAPLLILSVLVSSCARPPDPVQGPHATANDAVEVSCPSVVCIRRPGGTEKAELRIKNKSSDDLVMRVEAGGCSCIDAPLETECRPESESSIPIQVRGAQIGVRRVRGAAVDRISGRRWGFAFDAIVGDALLVVQSKQSYVAAPSAVITNAFQILVNRKADVSPSLDFRRLDGDTDMIFIESRREELISEGVVDRYTFAIVCPSDLGVHTFAYEFMHPMPNNEHVTVRQAVTVLVSE